MTRHEIRWALPYSLVLALVTSLPYVLAAISSAPDWGFTGFLFAVEDGNSYIAKMLSGFEGAWLFRSPYSTAEQSGVLAFLPYLVLGKASDGSHAQLVALYHLFRVLVIPVLVIALYRFSALFIQNVALRRWTVIIATVGGGLGWLMMLLGQSEIAGSLPLEFYSPETFGFLAIYGLPHLTLARAVMVMGFVWYLQNESNWRAGIALLVAGIIHPPELLSAYAALAAHAIAILGFGENNVRWAKRLGRAVLPSLPLLAYLGAKLATDSYLQAWSAQNLILSPHPFLYLVAFGILLPAAFLGARYLLRQRKEAMLFPVAWAIAIPALAWAPLNIQRRLPEGGWVALTVLAASGLAMIAAKPRQISRVALAGLLIPSTLLILISGFDFALNPRQPAFRSQEELKVFTRLRDLAEPKEIVLASFAISNPLPAWAPVRVVAGHGPESARLAELRPRIDEFYQESETDVERLELIRDEHVSYVIHGPGERALGDWEPENWDCLELVDSLSGYDIFKTCLP
ncbi:MAG: hypothetical protein ACE5JF_02300 [Anaerolineales bacterium]